MRESSIGDIASFFESQAGSDTMIVSETPSSENTELKRENIDKFYSKLEEMGFNLDELREILECEDTMLILSGAGAGKTTALVFKIIRDLLAGELLKTRVINGTTITTPANILVSTFLKTGAEELKQNFIDWCNKLNIQGVDTNYIQFKTIHSEVYSALKTMGVPIKIVENTDSMIRQVMQTYGVHSVMSNGRTITKDEVADIKGLISYVRNRLDNQRYNHPLMNEYTVDTMQVDLMLNTFKQLKAVNGVMDFEDMQEMLLEGLQTNPKVVNFIQNRYDYVFVDEFQDTSQLQYEILKYYFKGAKKSVCLGDDDQCLATTTSIQTRKMKTPISNIKIGDEVLCSEGHGKLGFHRVDHITKKLVNRSIVRITTESGRVVEGTPEHIGFAKMIPNEEYYYTYLMYRDSMGYRLGSTSGIFNDKGKPRTSGGRRLNQEKGDKLWYLGAFYSLEEAEQFKKELAEKTGIPTYMFEDRGMPITMKTPEIRKMHKELNTKELGDRLLSLFGYDYNYPHEVPKAGRERCTLNYTMFANKTTDKVGIHKSELTANTQNKTYIEVLNQYIPTRIKITPKAKTEYTYAESLSNDIDFQHKVIKNISKYSELKKLNLVVKQKARISDEKYDFMPFGNIIEGMIVPVTVGGNIIEDKVVKVERVQYNDYVYDLSVPGVRNYVANDIVVHNCIYSWRGSDIDIINGKFQSDFKAEIKQLTTNYRCSQNILKAVIPSIEKNTLRSPKNLRSFREGGEVHIVVDGNVNHLMDEVRKDLVKGESVGILARTNADLLIPAILLELSNEDVDYGLSKSVSLEMRIPKQVFGVMDLLTKRYTPEFDSLLSMFTTKYKRYEVEKLCNVLNINKDKTLFTLPIADIEYSAPSLLSMLVTVRNQYQIDPKRAYIHLLDIMRNEVYNGKSIYAQNAREFVYYIKKIIQEHDMVKDMTITELDRLFNQVLSAKLERRKNINSRRLFIKLSTVHEAKGKEWDNVYIWNNIDGCFPNSVGNRELTKTEYEEERRVHYIAWTRPKKKLTVYTRSDRQGGFLNECDLSEAKFEEVKGLSSKLIGINNTETKVFEKKIEVVKEEETFEMLFDKYYNKYTSFSGMGSQEWVNLDVCETKLGGKENVINELKSMGVDQYPKNLINSAITDTLSSIALN